MDINEMLVEAAEKLIEAMNKTADDNFPHEIAEIVKDHSAGAAAAALAAGWIPGGGSTVAVTIFAGFI